LRTHLSPADPYVSKRVFTNRASTGLSTVRLEGGVSTNRVGTGAPARTGGAQLRTLRSNLLCNPERSEAPMHVDVFDTL